MSAARGVPTVTVIAHINLAGGFRGGERQTELLVRGLCGRGWSQLVVGRRGDALVERLGDLPGVDVRPVPNNPVSAARATAGADLVHVHEGRAGQAGLLANLFAGTPYIVTRRIPQAPSARLTTRLIYRRAAHIACVSNAILEAMQAYVPEVAKSCIHSALGRLPSDPAAVAALRARWPGRVVAGHVGALVDKHKGQTVIIEAARLLRQTHPEVLFVLVGSGRDEAEFKTLAADLPSVVFEGWRQNVGDYLAAFDLLAFPSREEGLGSTVLDAMSFGLPVVASRVDGLPEIVTDGETGFLVPSGDAAALADAVARLARDPSLRRRLGAAGRERAAGFSPEVMVEAYDRLYRQVLGAGPAAEGRP